ncbi:MAG: hypothetical protein J6D45_00540 [Clostridia bacterium]|nr:hypothetical protein [Clostridia bacterium]
MNNIKRSAPPIVGGSSLLVIFAVLCLTVFALLTISTAKAERNLSDVSANAVVAYYGADAEAEIIFAQIRSGEIPDGVTVNDNIYSYSCSISPSLSLYVEIRKSGEDFEVLCWQPVSSNR